MLWSACRRILSIQNSYSFLQTTIWFSDNLLLIAYELSLIISSGLDWKTISTSQSSTINILLTLIITDYDSYSKILLDCRSFSVLFRLFTEWSPLDGANNVLEIIIGELHLRCIWKDRLSFEIRIERIEANIRFNNNRF